MVHLDPTEQRIVDVLRSYNGEFVLQRIIRIKVWPASEYMCPTVLRYYIHSIREKFGSSCIETDKQWRKRGLGYRWTL